MPTDKANDWLPIKTEFKQDGYHKYLNNGFDKLARNRWAAGPIADRQNAGQDFAPRWYFATDEVKVYYNTGTEWDLITEESTNALPYRYLSTFDTLQAAVNWSAGNGTVFVDSVFKTDETNILIDAACVSFTGNLFNQNFAGANGSPAIVSTNSANNEPFIEYKGYNRNVIFNNIRFFNEGNARPFFRPTADFPPGFLGGSTMWNNVLIQDFGATDAQPYTVTIHNSYGGYYNNIDIRNQNAPQAMGAWHIINSNACTFDTISSTGEHTGDGETPCMYIEKCTGTIFNMPYIEDMLTDAAMQISRGALTIICPYMEGNFELSSSNDYRCGIQIGDGGISQGHTVGAASGNAEVNITGGTIHTSANNLEAIRVLNSTETMVSNINVRNGSADVRLMNYGGSNNDTISQSDINPKQVTVRNCNIKDIVNNSGSSNPDISQYSGTVYFSETNATNQLANYEIGFVENSTGGHSIVKKDDAGTIHVWDPDRTL